MNIARADVVGRLRRSVANQLAAAEEASGLEVRFSRLPMTAYVCATYTYTPFESHATIGLCRDWQDVDVAHELTHMQLELLEGNGVLAWRRDVTPTDALLSAMEAIRTLPDDEVVHSRLVSEGFRVDGDVLRPQFFDDRCTTVPNRLRSGSSLKNDGMAHLDGFGFGDLYRATLFVQVQLVRDTLSDSLASERLELLDGFIDAFSRHRPRQHRKAKHILQLFREHDVRTLEGHAAILSAITEMERLDKFMGVSSYVRKNGSYILPWPENRT